MEQILRIVTVLLIGGAVGVAQNVCDNKHSPTDQERAVQREIQERIDETVEAAEA